MHTLGNFKGSGESRAPYITVIAIDTATHTPQFAMVQESPNEIPIVRFSGLDLETRGILSDVSYSESRGQGGNGIIRRSLSLQIQTEHTKGYPFFTLPLSKKFYYGGQTVEDIYFAVYANDRSNQLKPIENGWFIGYYKIEAGVSWTEEQGVTRIPLVQILQKDSTKLGATEEEIPEQFFLFNPWFRGEVVPKVFGFVPRIKLLNAFPSISIKNVAGSINGVVQSNYTNVSTTIILEKFADQSSVLRQLISIGGIVRVRMADNEVIAGSLSYNSGTGEVTLTITARDTYYSKGKAYTFSQGEDYTSWNRPGHRLPLTWADNATVVIRGKDIIQDSNSFMKALNVNAFSDVQPTKKVTGDVVVQLNGWSDEKKGIIQHEVMAIPDPLAGADAQTVISMNSSVVVINTYDPWDTSVWPAAPYVWFEKFLKDVEFYYNNPDTSSAGSGSIGDAWSVVGIEPTSADYSCFIRNGFSKFNNTNIYAEGDGRLIRIPAPNIVSVTQSGTYYGVSNLAKITLTAAPTDMDIGATSNIVYTDALYKDGADEDRSERILYEILKESPLLERYAGDSITGAAYPTDNWLPYCGVLVRETEEVIAVVDRLCYQLGVTLSWVYNKYELQLTGRPFGTEINVTVDALAFTYPNLTHTDDTEMIENTAEITSGALISINHTNGYEYIPLYYDVEYGGWEDPFFKVVKSASNRAIRTNSFKFSYKFDMINDANSFNYAVTSSLCIGHPSGLSAVERYLKTQMTIDGCRWAALDPIVFRDFPMVSTADETDASLDSNGHPRYRRYSSGKRIMGAVCMVESVDIAFNVDKPIEVSLAARMSQTFVNAKGISIYNPPYPPLPPGDPTPDPNTPPNGGGGTTDEPKFGGSYSPMAIIMSAVSPIDIDSEDNETAAFTINIDFESLFTAGWRYEVTIEPEDGVTTALDGIGAFLTGDVSGEYQDKESEADESLFTYPTKNITLNVNYNWFLDMPPAVISRPLKLVVKREIYFTKTGLTFYVDFQSVTVQVTISEPRDIIAS